MRCIGDWLTIPSILLLLWCAFLWKGYAWHKERSQTYPNSQIAQPGCLSASQKSTLPHGTATHAMPVNWRVSAEDVTGMPGAEGRYIACAAGPGDPLIQEDLQPAPKIAPADGRLAYSFPLKLNSAVDRSLNAGMKVQVFEESGPALVTKAQVLTVICDDSCVAILEVTPAESQLLMREGPAKLRLVPRQ